LGAVGVDDEVVMSFVDREDLHGTPHVELEVSFGTLVVLPHDVPGGSGRVGARETESEFVHPGQVIDLVGLVQAQGSPTELPGPAGLGSPVEHDKTITRNQTEAPQVPEIGRASCRERAWSTASGVVW